MSLPIDRTNLIAAQSNQVPSQLIQSAKNIAAIQTPYDTIDELNNKVDALIAAGALSPYPPSFLSRQALINENFDIWQRGTTFNNANTNQYTADRWVMTNSIDTNIRVFQSNTVPDAKSKSSIRVEQFGVVSGAGAITDANQRIENYSYFGGQKVTFSGKILVDTGVTCTPIVYDGTAFTVGTVIVGDGTWKSFKVTATVGASPTALNVYIRLDRNGIAVGKGFNLSQVQLCTGDVALPFQPRSVGEELLLCQRYYRKNYNYASIPGAIETYGDTIFMHGAVSAGYHTGNVPFPPMRVSPTVQYWDLQGNVGKITTLDAAFTSTHNVVPTYGPLISEKGFRIAHNAAIAGLSFNYTCDAEI